MLGFRPLCLVLLVPVLAGAQEPSGLEKAKQDLKTLPAVRKESERAEIRLPSVAAPSPATDLPAPRAPVQRSGASTENAQSGETGNWLVDAMMKDEGRPTRGNRRGTNARDGSQPSDTDSINTVQNPNLGQGAQREPALATRERAAALEAGNPLTPFMAGWISQRDQALLLPKDAANSGFGVETSRASGGPDQALTITFRGVESRNDQAAGRATAQRAADNPFLEALQTPAGPAPAASPTPTLPTFGNLAPALTPPEPARETRPPPPIDLSKPSQDSKYFPQLKRF